MIVRHFDVKVPKTQPPQSEGWFPTWHGYYEMVKCESLERKREYAERDYALYNKGMITEADFERDCFLSVLADIKRGKVNMFELGAGWGRMSLALAGVIDYRVVPLIPVSYRCLAVEGEPTHCQWIREHFEAQNIKGVVVHGVVSSKVGKCWFNIDPAPASSYGQAIISPLNPQKIPTPGSLYNFFLGKRSMRVPMYTVDQLVGMHGFDHVDIIDMDVQGAEYEVALGAEKSIESGLIDYWLIGTHHRKLNVALKRLLSPFFDLIIDINPDSVAIVDGFPPIRCHDGIQLYERRGQND